MQQSCGQLLAYGIAGLLPLQIAMLRPPFLASSNLFSAALVTCTQSSGVWVIDAAANEHVELARRAP
jgi:hypothetical protein